MIHEQLIKRSMIIERKIAGNMVCEVAIDYKGDILGCGYNRSYNYTDKSDKDFISVFASPLGTLVIRKNGSYNVRVGNQYIEAGTFSALRQYYRCPKIIQCDDSTTIVLDMNGKVYVSGEGENDEYDAMYWENMDYISMISGGVIGITKEGKGRICGHIKSKYSEVNTWDNLSCIKEIENGIVGLKKDGRLICTGMSSYFTAEISKYTEVVSFDGTESVFAAVRSDGSVYYICSNQDNEFQELAIQFFSMLNSKKRIAVKLSPWGLHFIKFDGYIDVLPKSIEYSYDLDRSIKTLTNNNCYFKNITNNPPYLGVSTWKLFNDPDEVLKDYEIFENHYSYRQQGKCLFCGNGTFEGFLTKKCTACGHKK